MSVLDALGHKLVPASGTIKSPMQLPLFLRPRASSGVVPLRSGSATLELRLIRNPRARRYVLRVTDNDAIVVTLPRWGSVAEARRFAEQHTEWIARERLRRLTDGTARQWSAGREIWLRGERVV